MSTVFLVEADRADSREVLEHKIEALAYPQHDASIQIRYAEAMGLGSGEADVVGCAV